MYQSITSLLLRLFKVPHEPQPPHGDPASLRVFRAGRNLFNLRLFGWAVGQTLALAGIIFWVFVFVSIEVETSQRRQTTPQVRAPLTVDTFAKTIESAGKRVVPDQQKGKKRRPPSWAGFKQGLVDVAMLLPPWAFPLLWVLKIAGILAYLIQLPVTYLVSRLDYELRWYMVTDRSLRIRHGVWQVTESTMSFANIQQVVVSQGPLQRLLGLSDVKVQSAGGSSGGYDSHGNPQRGEDMHLGLFHSVTNAPEIRDLILERLRRFRESGLGDPEEKSHQPAHEAAAMPAGDSPDLLAAARELAAEARQLRASLG